MHSSAAAGSSIVEVTLLLPGGGTDLSLSSAVPVGSLIDRLRVDGVLPEAGDWRLSTPTGRVLAADRSLAAQGIRGGDHLLAVDERAVPAAVTVLDDDLWTPAPPGRTWSTQAVRASALATIAPVILAVVGLLRSNVSGGLSLSATVAIWSVVVAAVRRFADVPVAPTVVLVAVSGATGLTTASTLDPSVSQIGLAGAVGAGMLIGTAIAARLLSDPATAVAIGSLVLPLVPAGSAGWLVGPRPLTDLAALVVVVAMAVVVAAPHMGAPIARLLTAVGSRSSTSSSVTAVNAHRVAIGMTVGGVSAAVPAGLLVAVDGSAGLLIAAITGGLLLCRASAGWWAVAAPAACGAVCLLAGASVAAAIRPSTASVPVLVTLIALLGALVARPDITRLAIARRRWRRFERLAVATLVPLTVAMWSGFDALASAVLP